MTTASRESQDPLRRLTRRWTWLTLLGIAILAIAFRLLSGVWGSTGAARWAATAAIVLAYQTWVVRRALPRNIRQGEDRVLATFGPGTSLTLTRGLLIALLAGFLSQPRPGGAWAWAPAALYTAADLCDYFDGYLARLSHHATALGEALDLEYDALGLLVGVGVAIHYGQLPIWFLPFGLARYAFAGGEWAFRRLGRTVQPLPPSVSRRPIAGLTMAFVSVALWPIVLPAVATLAGLVFSMPFGASFGRDWLVVSGAIDPGSARYARWHGLARRALLHWAPIGARLAVGVSAAMMLAAILRGGATLDAGPTGFYLIALLGGAILIVIGFAGRLASIVLLIPIGLQAARAGPSVAQAVALIAAVMTLILGTGAFSLWQPEDRVFAHRAGEGAAHLRPAER